MVEPVSDDERSKAPTLIKLGFEHFVESSYLYTKKGEQEKRLLTMFYTLKKINQLVDLQKTSKFPQDFCKILNKLEEQAKELDEEDVNVTIEGIDSFLQQNLRSQCFELLK